MLLWLIRGVFLLVLIGTAAKLTRDFSGVVGVQPAGTIEATLFGGVIGIGIIAIAVDMLYPHKRISNISAIYFGLLIGVVLGQSLGFALQPSITVWTSAQIHEDIKLAITIVSCYVCISVLLQTRNDFRFIIPYVEFARQLKGGHPLILDASVIIDGRIADIADTGLLDQMVVVPRFVLSELQSIADSSDRNRRARGRRGLTILDRLQKCPHVEVEIHEEVGTGRPQGTIDERIILLTKSLSGKLVTNDINLGKLAKIHSVSIVNVNEVSCAAKPPVVHGEHIAVRIVKEGEGPGQGIGYLDDGTMVVAELGKGYVGQEVQLVVTSVLQTNAGRMVFGKIEGTTPVSGGRAASR